MSLNKAIAHKKEKRKGYRGSKRFDVTCRNHGACSYCRRSRTYQASKENIKAELQDDPTPTD